MRSLDAALADNPPDFTLGAGVGYSTVSSDDPAYGYPGYYNDHQDAWKVIVGRPPDPLRRRRGRVHRFRPAEQPLTATTTTTSTDCDSHPRAACLFGVGYLPLPMPFLDVYGKAGVARLQTDVTTTSCRTMSARRVRPAVPATYSRRNETDNKFAYGVGRAVQSLGRSDSARSTSGSARSSAIPDALTVSATWKF